MIYDPQFKPILEVGHTVLLKGSGFKTTGEAYRCLAIDALPEYQKDFGALTAATWDTDNEDTNLELETYELGQLRMMVLDDVKVRLKNPAAVAKWRTGKTNFFLPRFPSEAAQEWYKEYVFRLSEFFYWEAATPRFDLYSLIATSEARIVFTGWKFKLDPLTTGTPAFTLIVDGWPSTGK